MEKSKVQKLATIVLASALVSSCASDQQLRRIAEEQGISMEEVKARQLEKAVAIDEAIPGSVSGLIHGD